jgi:hypothetical protein
MLLRTAFLLTLGITVGTASSAHAQFKGDVSASRYGWLSSLSEGKAQASKANKPIMVVIRCVP